MKPDVPLKLYMIGKKLQRECPLNSRGDNLLRDVQEGRMSRSGQQSRPGIGRMDKFADRSLGRMKRRTENR